MTNDDEAIAKRVEQFIAKAEQRLDGIEGNYVPPVPQGQPFPRGPQHVPSPTGSFLALTRMLEEQEETETYDEVEIVRDCVACGNSGRVARGWVDDSDPQAALAEVEGDGTKTCPHCHGRGWLKVTSWEPPTLFSIHEVLDRTTGEWAHGVRHHLGGWHRTRLPSEDEARYYADELTLQWLEGGMKPDQSNRPWRGMLPAVELVDGFWRTEPCRD